MIAKLEWTQSNARPNIERNVILPQNSYEIHSRQMITLYFMLADYIRIYYYYCF